MKLANKMFQDQEIKTQQNEPNCVQENDRYCGRLEQEKKTWNSIAPVVSLRETGNLWSTKGQSNETNSAQEEEPETADVCNKQTRRRRYWNEPGTRS